jgi:glycosyltransferase involved in cell wall biosynthesis
MVNTTTDRRGILVLDNELGMGGSEKLLYDFAARFDRSRFDVGICCLKDGGYWKDRMIDLGLPFDERILRHKFDASAFRALARIIRDRRVELIDTYAHPNTVIFSYLAKAFGMVKRFVVNFHATGNPEGGRLVPTWLKPFLGDADALVALAETHRRYLVEVEGLHDGQIVVIHNGVDTERFRPAADAEGLNLRSSFGFAPEDTVLVNVASLKPAKRIDLLIEATAGLILSRGDVRLLLVGDGPSRGDLEALAGRLGIAGNVTFAGIRDDVDVLLRMSDALVLSSRRGTETFPTVVLEAMASGLPVVTTDVGSVRDMVEENRNALIVPPEDRGALAGAVAALVGDASKRKAFGARGRHIVLEHFGVDAMCENRQLLFERLLVD